MSGYREYWSTEPSRPPPRATRQGNGGFLSHLPPATAALIKINVVIYLITWIGFHTGNRLIITLYGILALSKPEIMSGMIWQPVTYMFLHAPNFFWHIVFNMFTLYALGRQTERAMGWKHFLTMYLLSGVVGGLGWLWLSADSSSFCVGASGAIFGVLGAFATLFPQQKITMLLFFVFPITLSAWKLVLAISFIQFLLITGNHSGGIAYAAHVFGAFAGFFYIDRLYESALLRRGLAWLRRHLFKMKSAESTTRRRSPPPSQEEVDRILDKINRDGIQSLTRKERQTLHRASRSF